MAELRKVSAWPRVRPLALAHSHPVERDELTGMIAAMTVESPTDGDVFLAYVEQVLCLRLQPGQMVVMDNLPAHKVEGVRRLLEAVGQSCCTYHPIRQTSIPSSKLGRKSNSSSVRPRRARWKRCNRRLWTPWLRLRRTTRPPGLPIAVMLYSNRGNALASAPSIPRLGRFRQ